MPADDTQSSSWGSSQRPASHLRRSLAAAGRRSTRQTRLRTSEWMHQGGTMARHQVHRCRWLACRRRSAAPPITISRLSRGKTVEKCTGSRPARNKKSPSRAAGAGGMKWHWHNARCTVPKAGLALLRAWAAVGWQEVGGPWRSEVGPVFIVYKQAANGREARRHISCQAHTPARCATHPKKPITPCYATLWRRRA